MVRLAVYEIRTKLPTNDVARIFRDRVRERPSGPIGLAWSRKVAWRFMSVPDDDDPFSAMDGSKKPAFRAIAHHSLAKRPFLATDGQVAMWEGDISLDIWDNESYRLVRMACISAPAPKAHVTLVVNGIRGQDPQAQVQTGKL